MAKKTSKKMIKKTSKKKTANRKTEEVDEGFYNYPTEDGPLGNLDHGQLLRLLNLHAHYVRFYQSLIARVPPDGKPVRECLSKEELESIFKQVPH